MQPGRPIGYEVVVGKLAEVTAVMEQMQPEDDEEAYEHLRALRARLLMALAAYGDAA